MALERSGFTYDSQFSPTYKGLFWPRGVFTMLGFAIGFALLLWATAGRPGSPPLRLDPIHEPH